MRSLDQAQLKEKTVLLRADLNVPLRESGQIEDDRRLRLALPTINFLADRGAKIVLTSHLGQPVGADKRLSLKQVYNRLAHLLGQPIQFAPTLFGPATKTAVAELKSGEILALENLRFEPGELNNSRTFARKLANYGEVYINDAFSVSHREAASIVAITEFLPSYPGLLFEKEYQLLTNLLRQPDQPFVAIVGGAKVADKLPLLRHLAMKAERILVGGAVANTFLASQGVDVKSSLVEKDMIGVAAEILKRSRGKIVLPLDYVWDDQEAIKDVGEQTIRLFTNHLAKAHTIFWSGNLGQSEQEGFRHGSDAIAQAMVKSGATTVVGGGNTAEIFDRLGLESRVTFISSGGGATLTFLSGQVLPGVKALN